eukprot:5800306-Prymnesium_polylepis.1
MKAGPSSITRDDSFDACRAVKAEEEAKALGLSTYSAPGPLPAAPGSPDHDALIRDLEAKIAEQEAKAAKKEAQMAKLAQLEAKFNAMKNAAPSSLSVEWGAATATSADA